MTHGGNRKGAGRPRGTATKIVRLPIPLADVAKRIAGTAAGDVAHVYSVDATRKLAITFASFSVQAGFPSPADDHLEPPLDFNDLLIENPSATFAVRIAGDSMIDAGIFQGDIAIVDRGKTAVTGNVVLALLNGEFTIKRYRRRSGVITLVAENKAYEPIRVSDDDQLEIWGVIKHTIRMTL